MVTICFVPERFRYRFGVSRPLKFSSVIFKLQWNQHFVIMRVSPSHDDNIHIQRLGIERLVRLHLFSVRTRLQSGWIRRCARFEYVPANVSRSVPQLTRFQSVRFKSCRESRCGGGSSAVGRIPIVNSPSPKNYPRSKSR